MANSPSGESMTERLVRVLETFTPERTVQSTAEIGRRAGLPPSSAHRIVTELIGTGLLEYDDSHRVQVGLRLWELATRSSHALRLRQIALPAMERVQSRIRQHTQLAILERAEVLVLERLSDRTAGPNVARVAGRLPLHASSSGLVLLAHADRDLQERVLAGRLRRVTAETITEPQELRRTLAGIRRAGEVIAPGYVDPVSTGVAVPVRGPGRTVVAALSVVLPREQPSGPAVAALRAAAHDIERELTS